MLIRIFYSCLNRSNNIIMDLYYNENPRASRVFTNVKSVQFFFNINRDIIETVHTTNILNG